VDYGTRELIICQCDDDIRQLGVVVKLKTLYICGGSCMLLVYVRIQNMNLEFSVCEKKHFSIQILESIVSLSNTTTAGACDVLQGNPTYKTAIYFIFSIAYLPGAI
jgi:hypothetical protein